jgi:hypothetical protein
MNNMQEKTEALIDASKEVGLEEITGKPSICFCLLTRMQDKIVT